MAVGYCAVEWSQLIAAFPQNGNEAAYNAKYFQISAVMKRRLPGILVQVSSFGINWTRCSDPISEKQTAKSCPMISVLQFTIGLYF